MLALPAEYLPAVAVTLLSDGFTHFVVLWARRGDWVEVMDPARGRRRVRADRLATKLFRHRLEVPAAAWRDWAGLRHRSGLARVVAFMRIPLSVLDLAPIARGQSAAESIAASVALARRAEESGYRRVWYAEHHNMPRIASSATSVLIAHVGAHTSTIRLGSGGVMLPNHSPLTIAEQFGSLEAMYPGRIDLGLGRAPGSDQNTTYALRRDPRASESFPQDVQELQAFLAGDSLVPGVQAVPGAGSHVPLYILGSSLFGAQLAAALGLPYAFASHFAPQALEQAIEIYRAKFQPSAQLSEPYVIAAVNVLAADTAEQAQAHLLALRRTFAVGLFGQGRDLDDAAADDLLNRGAGAHLDGMLTCTAVGTGDEVADYLDAFRTRLAADELITAHHAPTTEARLRSLTLTAEALAPVPV